MTEAHHRNRLAGAEDLKISPSTIDGRIIAAKIVLPQLDLSRVVVPKLDLSRVVVPKVDLSRVVVPKVDLSRVVVPKVDLSRVVVPKINIPDVTSVAAIQATLKGAPESVKKLPSFVGQGSRFTERRDLSSVFDEERRSVT
ncbi:hypothetical protein [Pseudarthrobacter sp. WHRI 8279]|uniref:hypothetical protein n=1 Tax=Pseudarthrobacter sp. WHRI 8279 TaxID=3162566 RepID=UPI0032EF4A6F